MTSGRSMAIGMMIRWCVRAVPTLGTFHLHQRLDCGGIAIDWLRTSTIRA